MTLDKVSFSVVIPVYNESAIIQSSIKKILEVLKNYPNSSLLIVNDGSTDNSLKIIKKTILKNKKCHLISHDLNQGYGAALRSGISKAINLKSEYVLFMDSDLTNDPLDISKFYKKMLDSIDTIKASRYSDGGDVSDVLRRRYYISKIGNLIASLLFMTSIKDPTNGFRAIRTSFYKNSFILKENNFSIIMEEFFYLRKYAKSFSNVGVILSNRNKASRPSSFSYNFDTFYRYFKYPCMFFLGKIFFIFYIKKKIKC